MPPSQPVQVLLPATLKTILSYLLPVLGLLLACERPEGNPAPTGPLIKATIDGVPWQANEAALKINTFNGLTSLQGLLVEGNTIKSNIEIILLDEIRVGDYPELAYPIYYEDDYRKSWSSLYQFSFTITRYEQQRVWGRFRFTAEADPSGPTQPAVRQITEGVFENVPVVEIK